MSGEKKCTMSRESLFQVLKGFDAEALAFELSAVLTGVSEDLVQGMLGNLKVNSQVAKKNRKVRAQNKKVERLKVLEAKKNKTGRLTKAEQLEANKLIRELGLL